MKVTVPEKTIEACDYCQAEGFIKDCDVCNRQFCLSHEGTVMGSWGFTCICRDCARRDEVRQICEKHAENLTAVFRRRNDALKKLGAASPSR